MSLIHNPLPLPLDQLGVKSEQFTHQSDLHGAGHVNRVIYTVLVLCKAMGRGELMPAAWAAAYLHDLSRKHDGVCHEHGRWAVEEKFDLYTPLFLSAGVKPEQFGLIKDAVIAHSQPEELPPTHPASELAKYLKDADALDRIRLGEGGLDQKYLRLEYSPVFVGRNEELFAATEAKGVTDLPGIWELAVPIFNKAIGLAPKVSDYYDEAETGAARRDRRISQGEFVHMQPFYSNRKLDEYFNAVFKIESISKVFGTKEAFLQRVPAAFWVPSTYTTQAALDSFIAEGKWRGFWELGEATWHTTFNDAPADCRAYNDKRLYGEKARWMTHGVLSEPFGAVTDRRLRQMYGPVKIIWNTNVLKSASFTAGDSQGSTCVIPYSLEAVRNMSGLAILQNSGVQGLDKLIPALVPFLEVQIHQSLTPDDIFTVS